MRRLTEAEFDALRCKRCGQRSDWHSHDDGACSDDDGPHPYSLAADADSGNDPRAEIRAGTA